MKEKVKVGFIGLGIMGKMLLAINNRPVTLSAVIPATARNLEHEASQSGNLIAWWGKEINNRCKDILHWRYSKKHLPHKKKLYLSLDQFITKIMQARVLNVPELLKKVANGDEAAFKQVYEYYFPKIQGFAFRVLHDDEYAKEIAQEVMLTIWQMGDRLVDIQNPDAFFKTLSKRRTIDAWRRLQIERTAEQAIQANWKEINHETEERIILDETRQIIEEAVRLLPPRQRMVYQLCQQQGLKYEEAARQLDIAPGTVQTHMKLALKFLRAYVQQRIDMAVVLIIFDLS